MRALFVILLLSSQGLLGQVGINTPNPQESLHLAGTTGTIRVESLNSVNNSYNGGDVNNDGDLSNDTYPLYVDEYGDLTLELEVLTNSEAEDEFDDTTLPTSSVELLGNDGDGKVTTIIKSYTVTFNRPTLLEVKYNLSHNIYADDSYTILDDLLARRVSNYITVSPDPDPTDGISNRKYGPCTKAHTSGSTNSVPGPFFNGSTVYIKIMQAGTYTIDFVGEVSSSKKWQGASGPNSLATYVEFAIDSDFLFIRLY
jgi:hypothetical protein